eukprot:g12740.t1
MQRIVAPGEEAELKKKLHTKPGEGQEMDEDKEFIDHFEWESVANPLAWGAGEDGKGINFVADGDVLELSEDGKSSLLGEEDYHMLWDETLVHDVGPDDEDAEEPEPDDDEKAAVKYPDLFSPRCLTVVRKTRLDDDKNCKGKKGAGGAGGGGGGRGGGKNKIKVKLNLLLTLLKKPGLPTSVKISSGEVVGATGGGAESSTTSTDGEREDASFGTSGSGRESCRTRNSFQLGIAPCLRDTTLDEDLAAEAGAADEEDTPDAVDFERVAGNQRFLWDAASERSGVLAFAPKVAGAGSWTAGSRGSSESESSEPAVEISSCVGSYQQSNSNEFGPQASCRGDQSTSSSEIMHWRWGVGEANARVLLPDGKKYPPPVASVPPNVVDDYDESEELPDGGGTSASAIPPTFSGVPLIKDEAFQRTQAWIHELQPGGGGPQEASGAAIAGTSNRALLKISYTSDDHSAWTILTRFRAAAEEPVNKCLTYLSAAQGLENGLPKVGAEIGPPTTPPTNSTTTPAPVAKKLKAFGVHYEDIGEGHCVCRVPGYQGPSPDEDGYRLSEEFFYPRTEFLGRDRAVDYHTCAKKCRDDNVTGGLPHPGRWNETCRGFGNGKLSDDGGGVEKDRCLLFFADDAEIAQTVGESKFPDIALGFQTKARSHDGKVLGETLAEQIGKYYAPFRCNKKIVDEFDCAEFSEGGRWADKTLDDVMIGDDDAASISNAAVREALHCLAEVEDGGGEDALVTQLRRLLDVGTGEDGDGCLRENELDAYLQAHPQQKWREWRAKVCSATKQLHCQTHTDGQQKCQHGTG